MNRITETRALNSTVTLMKVEAPDIAKRAKAGQFIILRVESPSIAYLLSMSFAFILSR